MKSVRALAHTHHTKKKRKKEKKKIRERKKNARMHTPKLRAKYESSLRKIASEASKFSFIKKQQHILDVRNTSPTPFQFLNNIVTDKYLLGIHMAAAEIKLYICVTNTKKYSNTFCNLGINN